MNREFIFKYTDRESSNDCEIIDWCNNNLGQWDRSRWTSICSISIENQYSHQLHIWFGNDEDATLFTLRWV